MITGKAEDETILVIDAPGSKITIERAPLESVDSHLLAEELTEMYADDEVDKRNIAVVSAGRGAEHARMGILNFSFYDWRRQVPRLKQAGRGGIGTVFRHKKLKAIVVKNERFIPAWHIADSKVSTEILPRVIDEPPANVDGIRSIIEKWNRDPEYVIEMMQDIQDLERYVSRAAIDELNSITGTPRAELFHIATFYKAFSLEPRGESVIQVCVGTACHVRGSARILEAFERALGIPRGGTTPDRAFSLEAVACLGCCSLAPVVKIGDDVFGNVEAKDVPNITTGARELSHV
jgi:NADH:ubiquinone oxidoreductase subunit E